MSCICFKCYSYEDPKKFAFKLFCHSRTIKNDVSRFREWSTEMFCRTAKKHCNEISQSANPETWKNSFGGHCTGLDKKAFTWLIDFLPIFPKIAVRQAVGGRGAAEGNSKLSKPFIPTQYFRPMTDACECESTEILSTGEVACHDDANLHAWPWE